MPQNLQARLARVVHHDQGNAIVARRSSRKAHLFRWGADIGVK
jgi:hypothetical protein